MIAALASHDAPHLGIDHKQFTYPFRGLDYKLTGVEEAHVVKGILT